MVAAALHQRLAAAEDRDAAVALVRQAVGHQSITGNEANFVAFLEAEMTGRRLDPRKAEFLPGRPNIWGERKGAGGGPRLQFIGHTDTVHVEGWQEHWAGTEREDPFAAAEVDGAIWGRGVADLKGGICASLAALDLLDRAGLRLKGDVAYAFVGDEESGEEGTGISAGAGHWSAMVAAGEIGKPDFAVYVEPSQLAVYAAQIGFFICDVTITGKSAYFGKPELGVDALKATHSILSAIWSHADKLQMGSAHPLTGRASVLVTTLAGGGYIAVPGECRLSVIATLRPGDTLDEAVHAFEAAVRAAPVAEGIAIRFAYPAGRDHALGGSPVEIDPAIAPVRLLQEAVGAAAPGRGRVEGAPFWSEMPFLVDRLGCPTVYCAPGDIGVCHTFEEHLAVDEYLAAIRAYAAFMATYCGVSET